MSNGKGSRQRPLSVSAEEYGSRFDRIFGSRHSVSEELPWLVPPPATPKDRSLQQEWDRLMRGAAALREVERRFTIDAMGVHVESVTYEPVACPFCGSQTCRNPECGG